MEFDFVRRLRRFFRRKYWDQERAQELEAYLEIETADNIARGLSPEEARHAAHLKLGNTTRVREDIYRLNSLGWLETFWQDLLRGARTLAKNPGFMAVAVLSLALGIGATTAVFSLLDTIFLRPLPCPEPNRLVGIWERRLDKPEPDNYDLVPMPTFDDWKKQSRSFEILAETIGPGDFVLSRSDRADQITGQFVSEGYFQLFGAKACQGRLFVPEEFRPGKQSPVVVSHSAWQKLFATNPAIIGSTFKMDGIIQQVVGVMCPEYRGIRGYDTDLWFPLKWVEKRETRWAQVVGRLKPGVTIQTAQAEMDVIEARLAQQYPDEQRGYGARILPLAVYFYGNQKKLYVAFLGAVGLLLLIACTNVANLVLARSATREREMALRASLGAGRPRLLRQLLTESLLLAGLGAGLGALLAHGGVRLALYLSPAYAIPRADEISVDVRILAFVVLVTCLTALLFGLYPALGASKPDLNESLKEGGRTLADDRGARRVQGGLVIVQIAFSLMLLVGAGLMIHNVWRMLHASVGFSTNNLTQMYIQFSRSEYLEQLSEKSPFWRMNPKTTLVVQGIAERLKALPGVSGVSVTGSGLLWGCNTRPVSGQGPPRRDDYDQGVCFEPVSPGYFQMLEIPVLAGRAFTDDDRKNSAPVAVISQSVAQQYFPGQDPLGKMINIGIWEADAIERRQVIGVVADIRWTVFRPLHSAVYYPYAQLAAQFHRQYAPEQLSTTFLVRSSTDPARLKTSIERAVWTVTKDVMIGTTETVNSTRRENAQWSRFFTWLLAVFAGTALVLAAVGVFGVKSYAVSRRTHEIGVRMALGAHPADVRRLILQAGLRLTLIGLALGLGGAIALTRLIGSQLSGAVSLNEVKPADPATLAVAPFLIMAVALLACYIPARRATKVDPMAALRCE